MDLVRMQENNVEHNKYPVLDEQDAEPVPVKGDREMMIKLNVKQRVRPELINKNLNLDMKYTRKRSARQSKLFIQPLNKKSTSVNNQARISKF